VGKGNEHFKEINGTFPKNELTSGAQRSVRRISVTGRAKREHETDGLDHSNAKSNGNRSFTRAKG
jgi:hypothetical protein